MNFYIYLEILTRQWFNTLKLIYFKEWVNDITPLSLMNYQYKLGGGWGSLLLIWWKNDIISSVSILFGETIRQWNLGLVDLHPISQTLTNVSSLCPNPGCRPKTYTQIIAYPSTALPCFPHTRTTSSPSRFLLLRTKKPQFHKIWSWFCRVILQQMALTHVMRIKREKTSSESHVLVARKTRNLLKLVPRRLCIEILRDEEGKIWPPFTLLLEICYLLNISRWWNRLCFNFFVYDW